VGQIEFAGPALQCALSKALGWPRKGRWEYRRNGWRSNRVDMASRHFRTKQRAP